MDCSPRGCKESVMTEQLTLSLSSGRLWGEYRNDSQPRPGSEDLSSNGEISMY